MLRGFSKPHFLISHEVPDLKCAISNGKVKCIFCKGINRPTQSLGDPGKLRPLPAGTAPIAISKGFNFRILPKIAPRFEF